MKEELKKQFYDLLNSQPEPMTANHPHTIQFTATEPAAAVFNAALEEAGIKEEDFRKVLNIGTQAFRKLGHGQTSLYRLICLVKLMGYNEVIVTY